MKSWNTCLFDSEMPAYREYVVQRDAAVGAFLQFDPNRHPDPDAKGSPTPSDGSSDGAPWGALHGLPVAVKDNIAVLGFNLTCGSRMLQHLQAPFQATAVERLIAAGARVVGKTNLDEFGMGSSCDASAFQVTNNPWDIQRVAGGSSGGSVRQPAAFCGVYGLKPTYGSVSRYGLVAYASSLEVIGAMALDLDLLAAAFAAMRGIDPHDQSSIDYLEEPEVPVTTIGFLAGELGLDAAVKKVYDDAIAALRDSGIRMVPVELPMLEFAVPVYYTIATAEASANLARFNGVRYGHRTDFAEDPEVLMRASRNEGFGNEVKMRVLLGTFVLRSGFQDQFYLRAQKIRTAIRNEFAATFANVDALITPVFPTPAFLHGAAGLDPFQQKLADRFTTAANLAGIPALAIPAGRSPEGLPIGVQCHAPAFGERRLFSVAERLATWFAPSLPAGFPPRYSRAPKGGGSV